MFLDPLESLFLFLDLCHLSLSSLTFLLIVKKTVSLSHTKLPFSNDKAQAVISGFLVLVEGLLSTATLLSTPEIGTVSYSSSHHS